MICPLLEAIEIIDDATDIFDNMLSKKPPMPGTVSSMEAYLAPRYPRLRDLGLRLDWLTNNTDCPPDLVGSIGDLVAGMVENRRLPRWEAREVVGSALHSPEAMANLQAIMMGGKVK